MRVLIGGIVGAVVAAVVWMAIEHNTKRELGWMAVAVGLMTGLAVRRAAGAGARASYVRGALAVVLAMIACVGARQVYANVISQASKGTAGPAVVAATAPVEPSEVANKEAKA